MSVQIQKIVENFPDLVTLARGSKLTTIRSLNDPEDATPDGLIFVGNPEHFKTALQSKATAWVVSKAYEAKVPASVETVLVSPNVQLSMALIGKRFFPLNKHFQIISGERVHPTAQISPTARVGADCIIGPGAVIGDGCSVGEGCVIGANSVLEQNVKLGARTHLHPLVYIGHSCELGIECEVHPNTTIGSDGFGYAQDKESNHYRITHYGKVILEDRVHVGANVQIDRGTFLDSRIGAGTKIDNHCHFGHNIVIGKNTLITGGMIAAGSVTIGSYCVFGGRTTIAGHLTIGDRIHIGGMSGVTKSVEKPGQYAGLPLQDLRDELRTRSAFKDLPGLLKQVRSILKHLGLQSEAE